MPIVVIVFNNGGIYGGDRRQPALQEAARAGAAKGNFSADPVPTAFVTNARCAEYPFPAPEESLRFICWET